MSKDLANSGSLKSVGLNVPKPFGSVPWFNCLSRFKKYSTFSLVVWNLSAPPFFSKDSIKDLLSFVLLASSSSVDFLFSIPVSAAPAAVALAVIPALAALFSLSNFSCNADISASSFLFWAFLAFNIFSPTEISGLPAALLYLLISLTNSIFLVRIWSES